MGDNRNLSIIHPNPVTFNVLILSLFFSGSFIGAWAFFNRFLKQYTKATDIPQNVFRKRWLFGKVTAVGDGDNFHFFHAPGGLMAGWGWLRPLPELNKSDPPLSSSKLQSKVPIHRRIFNSIFCGHNSKTAYSNYFLSLPVPYKNRRNLPTISIRICGVDAPERAHFGNPAQPFSEEALVCLKHMLIGKCVWIKPLAVDQYNRCVAKVEYFTWTGWKNVSLEMIKQGLAVVYESRTSAEFDGEEDKYRFHELAAKARKRGIWAQKGFETPGEYKKKI
ncbi:putative endonuclease lcl3 [Zygosaccharomyces mellis]|uniref:Probable endonuclease LCL3 n=1 Tax=Zygosaccharomyces mellis TaxID=42258 RepID=A0A4C2E6G1_9SACH|nr:putative endonuclease lcl3 [Zygosaccharomyces mellis]